jgi:nucleoid-associated protein YgaU
MTKQEKRTSCITITIMAILIALATYFAFGLYGPVVPEPPPVIDQPVFAPPIPPPPQPIKTEPPKPLEDAPEVAPPPNGGSDGYVVVGGFDYTIQPGDNLWNLALLTWGTGTYWRYIYADNFEPPDPPDLIHAGNTIYIRAMVMEAEE